MRCCAVAAIRRGLENYFDLMKFILRVFFIEMGHGLREFLVRVRGALQKRSTYALRHCIKAYGQISEERPNLRSLLASKLHF